ncbi:hypothetical protein RFI_08023 [Reticulomyxa filosa]|uniref:NACHT domain-containing protein n=1 Tax=Reticulomyxa filosa TaxID=46433 RepID=X6NS46_RETFI|nr:hypothetical protein RFI_08023 [Reticulomyxa filosa]|eukprot:ETO29105.1 hypothetical protein RFI_08023 [Reticulomyxa filosa]
MNKIEEFIQYGGKPLMVTGESGIGKTTLLANFDYKMQKTEKLWIIARYIGVTPVTLNITSCFKSILYEIKRKVTNFHLQIPNDSQDVIDHTMTWLTEICEMYYSEGLLVLLLDGVDQWSKSDQLTLVNLIPTSLHPRMRIILSCNEDNSHIGIARKHSGLKKKFQWLNLAPMKPHVVMELTVKCLAQYGKVFDEKQKSIVSECKLTSLPLFLMTFLDEIKSFGSFEKLNDYMTSCLSVQSTTELFIKIFKRINDQFVRQYPRLVPATLETKKKLKGCLEEILHLSVLERTFPTLELTSLLHQLQFCVHQVSGMHQLNHKYAKDAIGLFISQEDIAVTIESILLSLCHYFCKLDNSVNFTRKLTELPACLYQLIEKLDHKEAKEMLQDFLIDTNIFQYLTSPEHIFEFHSYWQILEKQNQQRAGECYGMLNSEPLLAFSKLFLWHFFKNCLLTSSNNTYEHPIYFWLLCLKSCENENFNKLWLAATVVEALQCCEKIKQVEATKELELDTEQIMFELAKLYDKQGGLLHDFHTLSFFIYFGLGILLQGKYHEAMAYYKDCIRNLESHDLPRPHEVELKILVRQSALAGILKEMGCWKESLALYKKCIEDKSVLLGKNSPLLGIDMNNIAALYLTWEEQKQSDNNNNNNNSNYKNTTNSQEEHPDSSFLNEAKLYVETAKDIFERHFGKDSLQVATCFSLLGSIFAQQSNHHKAITLFLQSLQIKEAVLGKDHVDLATLYNNLAVSYQRCNDVTKSQQCLEKTYQLLQNHAGLHFF